ncbi:ribosomal RNA small subunit methyltransferase A [Geobacter sp. OR-1]|uniref:16S rRNA (adenine(1518)-N(6)/adenine(1519)-N(6))- dimethyltransferase RsmA n=1 Tax=Geobacter sp. OR-1 TaxID=1266765 RepID=UPI0005431F5B|nr:16S rRNA (adenine(1518)-N(6)/adenine(1519)-N(6))-dimethyltransferase RsmA [Geobacter sp. OR-1]GAM07757.1 ribosomal RNA small subunit methyltransferase A [Geobacter sp. OR-1]
MLPRPKKALGQNFLTDRGILDRIVAAVAIAPGDRILEVGPGRGALTRILAESAAAVLAIELDRQLVALLSEEFSGTEKVEVVQADILRLDLDELLQGRDGDRWKVAANLPYNISSQVMFKFLDHRKLFRRLVLMLQREVGERLVAGPGTKDYGILSVLFQIYFDIRKEFIVKPGAFYPVPKVDSIVLSFEPLPEPRFPVSDEQLFRQLVKSAFAQRRKTLWNCLKGGGFAPSDDRLRDILTGCGIEPSRRGETLTLKEFALLAESIYMGRTG